MSITQTIQIADKPTLDNIKSSIDNNTYGLEAIKSAIDNSGGGGASPTIIIPNTGNIAGKTLTIFDDNGLFTHTVVFPNDGSTYITYEVEYLTVWYVYYSSGKLKANVNVIGGILANVENIPTWASGTDDEIAEFVELDNKGLIDLSDYWSLNDERKITISQIEQSGTYDGVSWSVYNYQYSQDITLVLMDTNKYDLVTSTTGGRTKSRFVVGVKNCLVYQEQMNGTDTNAGSWDSCVMRPWCNGGFRSGIPEGLRGIFKQFKTPTINEGTGSTMVYSNDYFAFWAEKEIFGTRTYSTTTEANALSQIEYYKTSSYRIKYAKDTSTTSRNYWLRSPRISNTAQFCFCTSSGGASATNASATTYFISPFGCI